MRTVPFLLLLIWEGRGSGICDLEQNKLQWDIGPPDPSFPNPNTQIKGKPGDIGNFGNTLRGFLGICSYTDDTVYWYLQDQNGTIFFNQEFKIDLTQKDYLKFAIGGLTLTDWNADGLMDVVVYVEGTPIAAGLNANASATSNPSMWYYEVLIQMEQSPPPGPLKFFWSSAKSNWFFTTPPLMATPNFDIRPDLIADQIDGTRVILYNYNDTSAGSPNVTMVPFTEAIKPSSGKINPSGLQPLAIPHSSAFVDINGDCKADMLFVVQGGSGLMLELWIAGTDPNTFTFDNTVPALPPGSGQISLMDWNRDGTIDILVPVCPNATIGVCDQGSVYTFLNQQAKVCLTQYGGTSDGCILPDNLCGGSGSFSWSAPEIDTKLFATHPMLAESPITFSAADYDADGWPDILYRSSKGVVVASNEYGCIGKVSFLYRNVFGNANSSGFFFDLRGDLELDIAIYKERDATPTSYDLNFWATQIFYNVKFNFKTVAIGLNGLCITQCFETVWTSLDNIPYGVNYHGATMKITVPNNTFANHAIAGAQLPQSAYSPLQLPYAYFGSGPDNNFVTNLVIGMPSASETHYRNYVSLIPNSMQYLIPYYIDNAGQWSIITVLYQADVIWYVVGGVGAVLGFIAMVVFIMDIKERVQDRKHHHDSFRVHFINA